MLGHRKSLTICIGILSVFLIDFLSSLIFQKVFGPEADLGEVKLILLRTGIVAVCCSVLISIFALKQFQNASPPSLSSGKRKGLALATAVCAVLSVSFLLISVYGAIVSPTVYERLAEGPHAAITDPVSLLCTALADGVSQLGLWFLKFVDFIKEQSSAIIIFLTNSLPFYLFSGLLFFALYGSWRLKKSSKGTK